MSPEWGEWPPTVPPLEDASALERDIAAAIAREIEGQGYRREQAERLARLIVARPCSCGKDAPFDGGAEGVCECCSTCGGDPAVAS